jgi:hypothetical protein
MSWNNTIEFYTEMQVCAVCEQSKGYMRCSRCDGAGYTLT